MADAEWFTVAEAARLVRLPARELRRAIQRGDLPAVRISPRRTFVTLDVVTAWKVDIDKPRR